MVIAMLEPRSASRRRARRTGVLVVVAGLGLVAYLFRHRVAEAFGDIRHVEPWWVVTAVVAALVSLNCFARTQQRMLHAGGSDVPAVRMIGLAYAANAVNWTLPGGTALSAAYVMSRLRNWGASTPAATFALAASALLSSVTFAGLIAVCVVLGSNGAAGAIAGAGGAVALLALVLLGRRKSMALTRAAIALLRRVNRLLRRDRDRGIETVERFMADLWRIRPRRRDWLAAAAFATGNWTADLLCLVAACRAVEVDWPGLALLAGSYIAGMTASSISLVPGGFGIIDVAMVLALTAGGVNSAGATATVLLYRLISCVLLVAAGWVVWTGARVAQRRRLRRCLTSPSPGRRPARSASVGSKAENIDIRRYCGQSASAASATPSTRRWPNRAS